MDKAISTDGHNGVELAWNKLAVHDLSGVTRVLRLYKTVVYVCKLEERLCDGPVLSGSSGPTKGVQQDKDLPFRWVLFIIVDTVFHCPEDPSTPLICHF